MQCEYFSKTKFHDLVPYSSKYENTLISGDTLSLQDSPNPVLPYKFDFGDANLDAVLTGSSTCAVGKDRYIFVW